MHEGCNARAWLSIEVGTDLTLEPADIAFITGLNDALAAKETVLNWDDLRDVPRQVYEVFEPLLADKTVPLKLHAAQSEIHFYTWGDKQCCLERGSTSATLLDALVAENENAKKHQALQLQPGDVLIFEEVLGAKTGLPGDADRPPDSLSRRLRQLVGAGNRLRASAHGDLHGICLLLLNGVGEKGS